MGLPLSSCSAQVQGVGLSNNGPPTPVKLEHIQPHMAQKPVLRGEVGCACVAREVSFERGPVKTGARVRHFWGCN